MRYVLIYGAIAGGIAISLITASIAIKSLSHLQSEWFGYTVMLAALSLIFVGVKRYRDVECGGTIHFGRALLLGLGIALVAGLIYVAGWELYLATQGGDPSATLTQYLDAMIAEMRAAGASQAEMAAQRAQMAPYVEAYRQPLPRMAMTFSEIAPVGLLVALVSAAILRNPRVLPARAG